MSKVTEKTYGSQIKGAIHEMMKDAHDVEVVSRATLRNFDKACLAHGSYAGGR